MKNPRSDPAPGGSSSQGSGETEVAGVEKTTAWTGEKKTKFQSTPLGTTAREPELGQIEGFDWDDAMLKEDIDSYSQRYKGLFDDGGDDAWEHVNDQQRKEMELRFAICRIKAYKMSKGEVLTNEDLKEMYPPSILEKEGYFQWLEDQFEWYFDPEFCKYAHLEDYQRLALGNAGEYLEWESYHNTCSTLQSDKELVYFWDNLSSKTEWIKNFLSVDRSEWKRVERVVFYHAVKIAKDCKNIYSTLLHHGYSEYLWSVNFDNMWYVDFAGFYFELWKLVAKQKMSFKDTLDQVKEKGMRTLCRFELKDELDNDQQWWFGSAPGPVTRHYNTYVAEINENLTDGDAYKLVMEAVKKFVPKPKTCYDYAKKKLEIALKIGLIHSSERGPTCQNSSEVTA